MNLLKFDALNLNFKKAGINPNIPENTLRSIILGHTEVMFFDLNERFQAQADIAYRHGGGWRPMSGWTLDENKCIKYPGDSKYWPLFKARLEQTKQTIYVYRHAWFCVVDDDGSFEVARMD